MAPGAHCVAGSFVGVTLPRRYRGSSGWAVGSFPQPNDFLCPEVRMVLFSRSFVRKGVISLATTASVATSSLALAKDASTTHHLREASPIHYVTDSSDHAEN